MGSTNCLKVITDIVIATSQSFNFPDVMVDVCVCEGLLVIVVWYCGSIYTFLV